MPFFPKSAKNRNPDARRGRRGAVAVMALLIVVVMAVLFQAYLTHVMSDMNAGNTFDRISQYNGERMAIGNLVKEAVLQYYERPRVGQNGFTIQTLLNDYLNAMDNGGPVAYVVNVNSAFPLSTDAAGAGIFWPRLAGNDTPLSGAFVLHNEALPQNLAKSRVAQFVGDPAQNVLSVRNGNNDIFQITVSRIENARQVNFVYYIRLFQVPVTDFNLIAYGITDVVADIPAAPPAINGATSTSIANGNLSVLALSRMDAPNDINRNSAVASTAYPYLYRELFSAAAGVWEYVCYNNTDVHGQNINYMMDIIPNRFGVYVLEDPYMGDVQRVNQGAGGAAPVVDVVSDLAGTNGFDPDYRDAANNRVSFNGYRVDADGEFLYTNANVADPATGVVVDTNGDGIINEDLDGDGVFDGYDEGDASMGFSLYGSTVVPAVSQPVSVSWVIDLDRVPNPTTGTDLNYRRIYIHLPDDQATITAYPINISSVTITDSNPGATTPGATLPVIICVEGWSCATKMMLNDNTRPNANYTINLEGNLTDQQVMLYAAAADVLITDNCQMSGMLLFDDRLSGFATNNNKTFTLNGLVAWNGTMPSATIGMNDPGVTINRLAGNNDFRAIAPRFLLVDVRSETQ